jgi:protein-L-isoaspartate(D-aspartate) O-methyltransferase
MATLGGKMTGIGMTSERTRTRMVERLREQGIRDEAVLAAMTAVPRHIFVDEALAIRAYEDTPLPIGSGQTISQPWVVARMTELARHGRTLSSVLEIGTGCGYQTAVLAHLAADVYTVERIGALVARARRNLLALKLKNIHLKHGDGSADLGEELAVDAIIVTAGTAQVPTALLRHLKPGGRMVLPLAARGEHGDGVQRLTVIEATPGGYREQTFDAVRFVPLLSGLA